MPLGRGAVVTFEQVVTAETDEGVLLLTIMSFQHTKHRGLEIVIRDPPRHATKEPEGLDVTFKKGFLFLERERHHKARFRIIQPHHKKLYCAALLANFHSGFTPVHLRILPRLSLST